MTQYIVFRHTEETRAIRFTHLRKYYELSVVGFYTGERGKKKQSIKSVAALLSVPESDINLVPMVVNGADIPTSIARMKGDIVQRYGINAQDALNVFPSPDEVPTGHDFFL